MNLTKCTLHKILLTPHVTATSVIWNVGYINIHIQLSIMWITQNKWTLN